MYYLQLLKNIRPLIRKLGGLPPTERSIKQKKRPTKYHIHTQPHIYLSGGKGSLHLFGVSPLSTFKNYVLKHTQLNHVPKIVCLITHQLSSLLFFFDGGFAQCSITTLLETFCSSFDVDIQQGIDHTYI
jgi:hypothetical protein